MSLRMETQEKTVTARLDGEIDHHTAKGIREEIDEYVGRVKPETLVLDFKDVSFMDSSGIGLVMGRYKLMTFLGGHVTVLNTSPQITRVMKLAGLERLVTIKKGGNN